MSVLLSSVRPLPAHRLCSFNRSLTISPWGERSPSPSPLVTSTGINAECQRRAGDSELPRMDTQVCASQKHVLPPLESSPNNHLFNCDKKKNGC
ncbi:hypothetical protein Q5P01_007328 [Channa striata]|uniref:Uncharacterized protein n=1 Tax=Channa striata TaxID=64152 RepID=A0AA88SYI8_CHASR|nr:hypothetical protein Q5P01_007328 [Channa striata]